MSASADCEGGSLLTTPITFAGSELAINFSTSAIGGVRIELQSAGGAALPGFSLAECDELFGDSVERVVSWRRGQADVSSCASLPVRLLFQLHDADVFSFQFS